MTEPMPERVLMAGMGLLIEKNDDEEWVAWDGRTMNTDRPDSMLVKYLYTRPPATDERLREAQQIAELEKWITVLEEAHCDEYFGDSLPEKYAKHMEEVREALTDLGTQERLT